MSRRTPRPVRQYAVFVVLGFAIVACAVGAMYVGQPNSWLWFGIGSLVAAVVLGALYLRRKHHLQAHGR